MIEVQSITLNKGELNLKAGEWTYELKAMVTPANATCQDVCWSSDDTSIVYINKQSGGIHAIREGSVVVKATICDGTNRYAYCIVHVTTPVSVSSVTINSANMTMISGETANLTATVSPANATFKEVSWTSSNSCVVAVHPVAGYIRAKKPGVATITVTTKDENRKDSINVVVYAPNTAIIKSDDRSFCVAFMDGNVWRNIGVDLKKSISDEHRFLPGQYEDCSDAEKSYLDNCGYVFTDKQLAFLYLLDPLGIVYYLKSSDGLCYKDNENIACPVDRITCRLERNDRVYTEIFGVRPKAFLIDDDGTRYNIKEKANRLDYFTDAELLFGGHTIGDFGELVEESVDYALEVASILCKEFLNKKNDPLKNFAIDLGAEALDFVFDWLFFSVSCIDSLSDSFSDLFFKQFESSVTYIQEECYDDFWEGVSEAYGWIIDIIKATDDYLSSIGNVFVSPDNVKLDECKKVKNNTVFTVLFANENGKTVGIEEIIQLIETN